MADQTDTVATTDTAVTLQASVDTSQHAESSDSGRAGAVLAAGAAGAAVAAAADRDDNAGAEDDRLGDTNSAADQSETMAVSDSGGIADPTDTVTVSDTALQASADTSHHAEPSDSGRAGAVVAAGAAGAAVAAVAGRDNHAATNGDPVRPPEDASETRGQVTTDDPRAVASAETLDSERIRPPEDSTEILGNVTSYETADEEPVDASDQVAASVNRTDEVGAAAVTGTLTGADAAALMTRQGARCSAVDPESDAGVRWDMASTPVTLNPCGLGSMNLSKVWTEGQRGSGAAAQ
jgi:hypothetical protein